MSTIPDKIGRYKIARPLGSGLMGDVFLGEVASPQGKEYMAIKVLNPKMATRRGDSAKFIREISNENIMRYLSIDPVEQGSDQYYLVMDFLEVRPVSRRALRSTLSCELLELFAKLADACQVAHEAGVCHGNIKPTNILFRRSGGKLQPILSDWGLEYVYAPEVFVGETFDKTIPYWAPESAKAFMDPEEENVLTPASDVYSLVMVLLEILIRKPLFAGAGTLDKLLAKKVKRKYMLLNVNFPKMNVKIKQLNDLIRRNLSMNPADRTKSMKELAAEFRAAIAEEAVAK